MTSSSTAATAPSRASSAAGAGPDAAQSGCVWCELRTTAALRIEGDDSVAFLHAQLTSDVKALAPGAAQMSAWCSPKGRVLATGLLYRRAPTVFDWLLPAQLLEPVRKRLQMFVLRAKVLVRDESAACVRLGLGGPLAGEAVRSLLAGLPETGSGEGALALALSGGRELLMIDPGQYERWIPRINAAATAAAEPVWQWLCIRSGEPTITLATRDLFVPQMLNWELQGGVSFTKGCYPGQEIVARMQYLGKLKERLYLAHVLAAECPQAGDKLLAPAFGDQRCGTVVNAAGSPGGGFDLLAVIQISAAGDARLASAEGPRLSLLSLPYRVPDA